MKENNYAQVLWNYVYLFGFVLELSLALLYAAQTLIMSDANEVIVFSVKLKMKKHKIYTLIHLSVVKICTNVRNWTNTLVHT